MAILTPKFYNKKVAALADRCGLVIDTENSDATALEIDFFMDKLIDEMVKIVRFGNPNRHVEEIESWKSTSYNK